MIDFLIACSTATVILIIYLLHKCYIHSIEKELFNQVSYCVCDNSMLRRCYGKPSYLIRNTQIKLNVPTQHQISGKDEWTIAEEILEQFRSDLIQRYFSGSVRPIHGKYVVPDEEFFMYTLCDFLINYRVYDMQTKLVYYKLFNIASCVRNDSSFIASKYKTWIGSKEIQSFLESNCK